MRSRYLLAVGALLLGLFSLTTQVSFAQNPGNGQTSQSTAVLFGNVRIFDGVSDNLTAPSNVLVIGNTIQAIGNTIQAIDTQPLPIPADIGLTRVSGSGRVLMPGLIDAHTHIFMETSTQEDLIAETGALERLFQRAQENAKAMVMRGFTSARDVAGPVFDLKRAVDRGDVVGPRIWPSGAMISQTSGHGDFRELSDLPRTSTSELSLAEKFGVGALADGVDEVLRRTREQLMLGASQIKLAAGGGVASEFDPIDVAQHTEAELRAAVEVAEDWNTYVTVHAYTPRAIQKAIRAGVKCIEHGQLIDEETAQMIAENNVWLSLQPFLDDEHANPYPEGTENRIKQLMVPTGTDRA
jgi:imidazolonepropionase-like amidohydrolase